MLHKWNRRENHYVLNTDWLRIRTDQINRRFPLLEIGFWVSQNAIGHVTISMDTYIGIIPHESLTWDDSNSIMNMRMHQKCFLPRYGRIFSLHRTGKFPCSCTCWIGTPEESGQHTFGVVSYFKWFQMKLWNISNKCSIPSYLRVRGWMSVSDTYTASLGLVQLSMPYSLLYRLYMHW